MNNLGSITQTFVLPEFATKLSPRVDINLQYESPMVEINPYQLSINLIQLSDKKLYVIKLK